MNTALTHRPIPKEVDVQYIEVRRHTMRHKPGQHLSQGGVELARRVGDGLGPFDRVITSVLPRAFETAIAMGFAVDQQMEELNELGSDVTWEISWDAGFAEFARLVGQGRAMARFAHGLAEIWRSLARSLPEGGSALVITHGGFIEAGTVASLPQADYHEWGASCDYCEGVRLSFDGEEFTGGEILRL
jgi:broad specificity phosphatase PhoE